MVPQQDTLPNPVVHVSPMPRHSWHESPDPPELKVQVCDGTQQSMLVVHAAESGQHSWHVPSWHVWDVLQQAAPLAVHALPSPTQGAVQTKFTHVLSPQHVSPKHAAPSATQSSVQTLFSQVSVPQHGACPVLVSQKVPRATHSRHLYVMSKP